MPLLLPTSSLPPRLPLPHLPLPLPLPPLLHPPRPRPRCRHRRPTPTSPAQQPARLLFPRFSLLPLLLLLATPPPLTIAKMGSARCNTCMRTRASLSLGSLYPIYRRREGTVRGKRVGEHRANTTCTSSIGTTVLYDTECQV